MSNNSIRIVEVSPRDGLQSEHTLISSQIKVELITRLSDAGLKHIEAASFVSPRAVPQMADSHQVMQLLPRQKDVIYSALIPNIKGLNAALDAGVTEVAIFTAASELFNQKNINCSIADSFARFKDILEICQEKNIRVRGYISTVFNCPYQGEISPAQVTYVSRQLIDMGCYEISLGDTIGTGTANKVTRLLQQMRQEMPIEQIAVHFHDTYGQALTNIYAALEQGIKVMDSSVAGLGGCPYAKGSSGNVATEDVVYLLNGLGLESGIDLTKLVGVGHWISGQLRRKNTSKTGLAMNLRR